jgi:DNA polymerase (family 10)
MNRNAIAIVLDEIAALLEIAGENRFKAGAFRNAARLMHEEVDLESLLVPGGLESMAGIGPATATVIRELAGTGGSRYYTQLLERTPPGLLELLSVPQLGPGRIRVLHEELGVTNLDMLEQAAREGRIARVRGYGAKTQAAILAGISDVRGRLGRRRYAEVRELSERLREFVAALPGVRQVEVGGAYRRGCETASAAELVACVESVAAAGAVADRFLALPGLGRAEREGDRVSAVFGDGFGAVLWLAEPAWYATTLILATGSAEHVAALAQEAAVRGAHLDTRGLYRDGERVETADESAVYESLGLRWIPPELREAGDALVAAKNGALPRLVEYGDLQGCFHCHTRFSDGRATVEEMAEAALVRGWRYLGIADHSQFASYAGGLSPEEIVEQHERIDAWNARQGRRLWLFKGIEADILPDGRLDYDDRPDLLARFDYVIASIHSAFGLPREEQTRRVLRALANPHVTFLGHATGRQLLARRGCDLDLESVMGAIAARGQSIEINSDPWRMELDWRHWPRARALGIRAAINPDAHSVSDLDYVHNGIAIARKGGLEAADIVNCWPLQRVRTFLQASGKATS